MPPLGLFLIVVGSIYIGIATPTEAAALGLMATLGLVAANGQLTLPVLVRAFEGTVRTTCMIMLIIIAAFFLNFVMVSIGLVKAVTDSVLSLGLPPLAMLLAIVDNREQHRQRRRARAKWVTALTRPIETITKFRKKAP